MVAGGVSHTIRYNGITMQDLGTLGGFDAYGYGINAGGQVVGYSKITGNPTSHAYRTTASVAGSDAPS